MLFSYVERGYEAILSGEKRLLEMLNLEKGEICIGASDMTLKYYLLPYLERFHEKYPNIRVTVTNAPASCGWQDRFWNRELSGGAAGMA